MIFLNQIILPLDARQLPSSAPTLQHYHPNITLEQKAEASFDFLRVNMA
jgi:hypothetical protein